MSGLEIAGCEARERPQSGVVKTSVQKLRSIYTGTQRKQRELRRPGSVGFRGHRDSSPGWRCPEERRGDPAPRTAVPTAAAQDGGCLCVQARRGASRCRTALLLKWRPPAFPVWNAPFRDPLVLKWLPLSSRSQSRARCSIESGTRHSSESPSIGGPKE